MTTADDFFIVDSYPGDAAAGCCYLTLAERGEIIEDRPDGPIVRPERIVVTPREVEYEGRLCLSERIVRHLAHKLGMVDEWRADAVRVESAQARLDLHDLSIAHAKANDTIEFLRELDRDDPEKVWLALDGTEHASRRAALDHTAGLLRLQPAAIAHLVPIRADEAPVPETDQEVARI